MKKYRFQVLIDGLSGVLVLGLAVGIAYLFFSGIIKLLSTVNSDLAKAVIAGSATVLVSVVSLIISKHMEHKAKLTEEIRQKKVPAYEQLIALMFDLLFWAKAGKKKPTDQKLVKSFVDFTKQTIIWGSEDVIKAYAVFRNAGWANMDIEEMMDTYEGLLKAMRKDLGHSDDSLQPGVLMSLFINADDKQETDQQVN